MQGAEAVDHRVIIRHLLDLAHSTLRNLRTAVRPACSLENAARLYLDSGMHVEYATPECANPWDAVRYVEAGHRTLLDLIQKMSGERTPKIQTGCYRVNVDYSARRHVGMPRVLSASDAHRRLPGHLIPHLVTRIIYPARADSIPFPGPRFTLSPRTAHIQRTISRTPPATAASSTPKTSPCAPATTAYTSSAARASAPISPCSSSSAQPASSSPWRRPASGQAAKSIGLAPRGLAYRLRRSDSESPFKAERSGRETNDRHRHPAALSRPGRGPLPRLFMPLWAPTSAALASRLDRSMQAPRSCTDAGLQMKLALFSSHALRSGIDWSRLAFWNSVHRPHAATVGPRGRWRGLPPSTGLVARNAHSRPRSAAWNAAPQEKGLDWDELSRMLALRDDFFQIDTRFGQLWPAGIFVTLDEAGARSPRQRHRQHRTCHAQSAQQGPRQNSRRGHQAHRRRSSGRLVLLLGPHLQPKTRQSSRSHQPLVESETWRDVNADIPEF